MKDLPKLLKDHTLVVLFILYSSGFIIWNFYLSRFGLFEFDLIQSRYLSAGLLICVPLYIIFYIYKGLKKKIKNDGLVKIIFLTLEIITLILLFWFFNYIPQYLGGGKPIPVSIIGLPEQIEFLSDFGVPSAKNVVGKASIQTYPICLIYQNDRQVLFFNATDVSVSTSTMFSTWKYIARVISLNNDKFSGISLMQSSYSNVQCGLSSGLYNHMVPVSTTSF